LPALWSQTWAQGRKPKKLVIQEPSWLELSFRSRVEYGFAARLSFAERVQRRKASRWLTSPVSTFAYPIEETLDQKSRNDSLMSAAPIADNETAEPPTVLVVEDEVLIRLMIAQELRMAGLRVVEAANADEAIRVLRRSPKIALMMTDLAMPGSMDGEKLAMTVNSNWPHIKIVIVSSFAPHWPVSRLAYTFIGKPFNPDRLVERIKQLLNAAE
jgi:two-component system, response regulator PdtaR